jgi:hypothetical protein
VRNLLRRIKHAIHCFRYNGETYRDAFDRVVRANKRVCERNRRLQTIVRLSVNDMRDAAGKLDRALSMEMPTNVYGIVMDAKEDLVISAAVTEEAEIL